ncbi:MAG: family 78 glycoside hydrolase catalytic domain, partial [Planctomycetota bacterium]
MRPPGSVLPACIIVVAIGLAAAPIPAITGQNPPDISAAQWIWDAGEAHPTNYFLMVRKSFSLEDPTDSAVLHITASDRYVLHVNGEYVGRGPARSDPRFKSYDTYQIGEKLKSGKNALAVLAYHYGQNTSPSGPYLGNGYAGGDRAGLWAKLEITGGAETTVISSGPDWLLTPALGWKRDVPPVNPLVGFPEWYDARSDPVDWTQPGFDDSGWQPATVIPEDQRPWKSLEARDVPMMRETEVFPVRIAEAGEVAQIAEDHVHQRFMKEVHVALEHGVLESPESLLADDGRAARAQAVAATNGEVREPFAIVDFGRQVFGFPRVKMQAPEGAVIDMITSPHLVDGRIATGSMHLGSRYIARDGEQIWQHFEYRQFRYLQIAVRSRKPVEIESVSLNA